MWQIVAPLLPFRALFRKSIGQMLAAWNGSSPRAGFLRRLPMAHLGEQTAQTFRRVFR